MHIIIMLVLVVIGIGLMGVHPAFGIPVIILGLLCFRMGSDRWRQEQESLIAAVGVLSVAGLICIGIVGAILG